MITDCSPEAAVRNVNYALSLPAEEIQGMGEQGFGPTNLRDQGDMRRWVVRVAQGERTINKYVFCYNEVHSQPESYAFMEDLSGETISRHLCRARGWKQTSPTRFRCCK